MNRLLENGKVRSGGRRKEFLRQNKLQRNESD